ncbi:hypothetical protein K435DRAFT_806326 [Dendrothele bispora CBS 962.96]|uniref:Cupredoxin n=1 Tax=Dendrothele bispora (strain CBS 962.96) TaxID=1314807 RepID=A0A4S8L7W8_DENBC|nr:hypothetical protein K435DRAFT_783613 [Dendrothele bispora CBS 962.96]THU84905.1 hypothetical protein K435DRAFT_806326 [Dendrothele bispora CBS 962.96]
MQFTALAAAVAFAVLPSALAANWDVAVGPNNQFAYSPTTITPAVGDTVTFTFMSRNHSATTTDFNNPCPPPPGGLGPGAFDTGFHSATTGDQPVVVVTIEDTDPHFVSCMQAAGAHCRLGMTLAINPTADQTYEQFLANALAD